MPPTINSKKWDINNGQIALILIVRQLASVRYVKNTPLKTKDQLQAKLSSINNLTKAIFYDNSNSKRHQVC